MDTVSIIWYFLVMEVRQRDTNFYQTKEGKEPAREWLESLKDKRTRGKVLTRIRRAETGDFGDWKGIGDGVCEMRIPHGPGFRVYFGIDDEGDLIILLAGGDKSTQSGDIEKAKSYWQDYKDRRPS